MLIGKKGLLISVAVVLILGLVQVSALAASQLQGSSSFYLDMVKKKASYKVLEGLSQRKLSAILLSYGADEAVAKSWDVFVELPEVEVPMVLAGFDFGTPNPTKDDLRSVLVSRGSGFSRYAAAIAAEMAEKAKLGSILSYTVENGDTVSTIAEKYGLTTTTINLSNDLTASSKLSVGKVLSFPSVDGLIHVVAKGDTVWDLAKGYKVSSSAILEVNGLKEPYMLSVKQKLIIPGATKKLEVKKAVVTKGSVSYVGGSSTGTFIYPTKGVLTSKFGARWGRTHSGIDIGVSTGTSVKASADGKVTFSGTSGAYGKLIIIEHSKTMSTYYAHNSSLLVSVGDTVTQGQQIALSGATGNVTGPHVHFEVRVNGKAVNPLDYLK